MYSPAPLLRNFKSFLAEGLSDTTILIGLPAGDLSSEINKAIYLHIDTVDSEENSNVELVHNVGVIFDVQTRGLTYEQHLEFQEMIVSLAERDQTFGGACEWCRFSQVFQNQDFSRAGEEIYGSSITWNARLRQFDTGESNFSEEDLECVSTDFSLLNGKVNYE